MSFTAFSGVDTFKYVPKGAVKTSDKVAKPAKAKETRVSKLYVNKHDVGSKGNVTQVIERIFQRYDTNLDGTGTVDIADDVSRLTINCIHNLDLGDKIETEDISMSIEALKQGKCNYRLPMTLDEYTSWFEDSFRDRFVDVTTNPLANHGALHPQDVFTNIDANGACAAMAMEPQCQDDHEDTKTKTTHWYDDYGPLILHVLCPAAGTNYLD